MADHSSRGQTARKRGQALSYYVREGSDIDTTGDRAGRWYWGHESDDFLHPYGAGYRTQCEAWEAALEAHAPAVG